MNNVNFMDSFMFGGGFPFIFMVFFVFIFGMIIFIMVKGVLTWNKNNNSPRLNVKAKVVTKRENISRHSNNNGGHHSHHTSTDYYVTFQFESGDRQELYVSGTEYGMLAEGDIGVLEFQGTRYLDFKRENISI